MTMHDPTPTWARLYSNDYLHWMYAWLENPTNHGTYTTATE